MVADKMTLDISVLFRPGRDEITAVVVASETNEEFLWSDLQGFLISYFLMKYSLK